MIGQFFGNYLLNAGLLSKSDFSRALECSCRNDVDFDLLVLDKGYLDIVQVNTLMQKSEETNEGIIELALSTNMLTSEQIDELMSSEPESYMYFAQALIDNNILEQSVLQKALYDYKQKYALDKDEDTLEQVDFYFDDIHNDNKEYYMEFLELIFDNLKRFVGDGFIPLALAEFDEYEMECWVGQKVVGDFKFTGGIEASETSFMQFAECYMQEELNDNYEYGCEGVGDFINLNNGLFIVNMSNSKSIEMTLEPPLVGKKGLHKFKKPLICLPLCFSFGIINVMIIDENDD